MLLQHPGVPHPAGFIHPKGPQNPPKTLPGSTAGSRVSVERAGAAALLSLESWVKMSRRVPNPIPVPVWFPVGWERPRVSQGGVTPTRGW